MAACKANNEMQALRAIMASRRVALGAFSLLFANGLTQENRAILCGEGCCEALALMAEGDDSLGRLACLMREIGERDTGQNAKSSGRARNADFELLRTQHTLLFAGLGKPLAPYWESVHLDDREMLFQESTLAVRNAYKEEGFELKASPCRIAEDGLPVMLEFLGHMAQKTTDELAVCPKSDAAGSTGGNKGDNAAENGNGESAGNASDDTGSGTSENARNNAGQKEAARLMAVQADFEQEHLLPWMPKFVKLAKKSGQGHFYPLACEAALTYLQRDAELLRQAISRTALP